VTLVGRLIVIVFALIIASLAAGAAIAYGVIGPGWHADFGPFGEGIAFTIAVFFASSFTGAVGLLPAAILIALAEAFKIRSLLVHLAAGMVLLVAGYYASGLPPPSYEESIDHPPPPISRAAEIVAAGGAVFGFAYWALAGRNAGRWRERRQPSA
jgi:hypothetical protein